MNQKFSQQNFLSYKKCSKADGIFTKSNNVSDISAKNCLNLGTITTFDTSHLSNNRKKNMHSEMNMFRYILNFVTSLLKKQKKEHKARYL